MPGNMLPFFFHISLSKSLSADVFFGKLYLLTSELLK